MNIKIKTWEALKMLKQVNPLLTNNEIPLEILNTVEELLENKDMGRNGYMILSILVYTFFSRMFDLMLPPVAKHSIVVA